MFIKVTNDNFIELRVSIGAIVKYYGINNGTIIEFYAGEYVQVKETTDEVAELIQNEMFYWGNFNRGD